MIEKKKFNYEPLEYEKESASNSYLMSLIAGILAVPLPIINLIATLIFYIANKKSSYFIRWHCTQALLSQLSMLIINSIGFWWTISVVFQSNSITNNYISYIIIMLLFNLIEFMVTIYTAIKTRKGIHVEWWLYGNLTTLITKKQND